MSTAMTAPPAEQLKLHTSTPSFAGIVRGEFLKMSRQWTTWIMLVLLTGIIFLPYIVEATVPRIKTDIQTAPLAFFYNDMETSLAVLRVFIGIFLIILTARVIGLEYQLGTIRVLLARGVGRLQLLGAKILAIAITAMIVFIAALLLNVVLTIVLVLIQAGSLNAMNALTSTFWSDTWLYMLTVLISMGVTILMAMAVTVVGRSLSFGLSAALAWFPVDNFGLIFLVLGYRLTHNDFWLNVTGYALGPNLNVMPTVLSRNQAQSIGITPYVKVDGTHTLMVTLVYAVIFVAVGVVLTWRRDVKE